MKIPLYICITVICAVLMSLLFSTGAFTNLQLGLQESIMGGGVPLDAIIIIGIDDLSIQSIGR
ncbi:MAG: hypothetical protein ACI8Y7_000209 [Candidatus Woesearchaeota archaeon]|jgi:hypothetical protein